MIDYPQAKQPVATELHHFIDKACANNSRSLLDFFPKKASEENVDPIFQAAKSIVQSLDQGFNLHAVYELFFRSYEFVKTKQGLSLEDQRQTLITLIDYIIDITDTPYLPDTLTDPIFKALTPSLLDLFLSFQGDGAQFFPQISSKEPSAETFQVFMDALKDTYSDGFQLSDIAVYIEKTTIFVMGFSTLTDQEKMDSICEIVNMIIDNINFGPLPSALTSPILKSFTRPLIQTIFSKI